MITITFSQLLDAIEKNGLPVYRGGTFFNGTPKPHSNSYEISSRNVPNGLETIESACALGQAGINLGATPYFNWKNEGEYVDDVAVTSGKIFDEIISLNDSTEMTLSEIAAHMRNEYSLLLDQLIEAPEFDYGDRVLVKA